MCVCVHAHVCVREREREREREYMHVTACFMEGRGQCGSQFHLVGPVEPSYQQIFNGMVTPLLNKKDVGNVLVCFLVL